MSLKRKTPLRRTGGLRRTGRLPSRGPSAKTTAKRERNFGGEADRVRAMTCVVAAQFEGWGVREARDEMMRLWGPVGLCGGCPEISHCPTQGAGGGRFDITLKCSKHHAQFHAMGVVSFHERYALAYGFDLRAKADAIALGHPDGLGIRGLAARFSWWARFDSQPPGLSCEQGDEWAEGQSEWLDRNESPDRLEGYDLEALLGWVRRAIERAGITADGDIDDMVAVRAVASDLGLSALHAEMLCETAGWPS